MGGTIVPSWDTRQRCALGMQLRQCPKLPMRRIQRSIYEEAREVARALSQNRSIRAIAIVHLKRILRLGRLRLRGPRGAQFEFTLAAIAQNLRRLAKLVARPPPLAAPCVA